MVRPSHAHAETSVQYPIPHEWARLIAKLRWIGMEEEAKKLELALSTLPPEERSSVSLEPFSTD